MAPSFISSRLSSPNYIPSMLLGQQTVSEIQTSKDEIDDDAIWEMTRSVFEGLECPFPEGNNPHLDSAEQTNQLWAQEMGIPSCKKFLPALLMAGAYRYCSADMLAIFTHLLTLIFIYDDTVEKILHKDPSLLQEFNRRFIQALESGGVGQGENDPLIKAAAHVHKKLRSIASQEWWDRFMRDVKEYCEANYWESTKMGIPEMETYLEKRPLGGAVYIFFDLCELAEGVQIKDEVFNSKYFQDVRLACNNLIWLSNDIISFPKETKNTGNNIIHIFQKNTQCNLLEAIEKTKSYYNRELVKLQSLRENRPSEYGDHEEKYIHGLLSWVRSNGEWSLKTPRYQKPQSPHVTWQKV